MEKLSQGIIYNLDTTVIVNYEALFLFLDLNSLLINIVYPSQTNIKCDF